MDITPTPQNTPSSEYDLVNKQDTNGDTALHIACKENDLLRCEDLLQKNASPNIQNKKGKTPLYIACCKHNKEIVSLLLLYGADPFIAVSDTKFCLYVAAYTRDVEVYKRLIPYYQDREEYSWHVEKAVFEVISEDDSKRFGNYREEHLQIAQLSFKTNVLPLKFFSDLTVMQYIPRDNLTNELFHYVKNTLHLWLLWGPHIIDVLEQAVYFRNLEVFSFFVSKSPSLLEKEVTPENDTLLHLACKIQADDIVKFIVEIANKNVLDIQNEKKKTALHEASKKKGSFGIVKMLIQHKAKVDPLDCNNRTPLFYYVSNNEHDIVEYLLKHYADVNAIDKSGMTPLYNIQNDLEMFNLLIKYGAKPWIHGGNSLPYISYHVLNANGYPEIYNRLLDIYEKNSFYHEDVLDALVSATMTKHVPLLMLTLKRLKLEPSFFDTITWTKRIVNSDQAVDILSHLEDYYDLMGVTLQKLFRTNLNLMFEEACLMKYTSLVFYLIKRIPALIHNKFGSYKETILGFACRKFIPEWIERLFPYVTVKYLCETDEETQNTPLHNLSTQRSLLNITSKWEKPEYVIQKLVKRGACMDMQNIIQKTPLTYAVDNCYMSHDCIKTMLMYSYPIKMQKEHGNETIYITFRSKKWSFPFQQTIKSTKEKNNTLIKKKRHYDIEKEEQEARIRRIHIDASAFSVVQDMISRGLDTTEQDRDGNTPLHKACQSRHWWFAVLLIQAHAVVSVPNENGRFPLDVMPPPNIGGYDTLMSVFQTELKFERAILRLAIERRIFSAMGTTPTLEKLDITKDINNNNASVVPSFNKMTYDVFHKDIWVNILQKSAENLDCHLNNNQMLVIIHNYKSILEHKTRLVLMRIIKELGTYD